MILDNTLAEAGDSLNEQARNLVKRYNKLATDIISLEGEYDQRQEKYDKTKQEIEEETENIKNKIKELKEKIKAAEEYKKNLAKDFRYISKIDSLNKLNRRVDRLKYEEYIIRDELYKIIEDKLQ